MDLLELSIVPSDYNELENLRFSWRLVTFEPDYLEIQLDFEQPIFVASTPEPDLIQVDFLVPSLFVDQETKLPLSVQT